MISRGKNKALLLLFEVPPFPLLLSACGKESLSVNCPRSWPHDSLHNLPHLSWSKSHTRVIRAAAGHSRVCASNGQASIMRQACHAFQIGAGRGHFLLCDSACNPMAEALTVVVIGRLSVASSVVIVIVIIACIKGHVLRHTSTRAQERLLCSRSACTQLTTRTAHAHGAIFSATNAFHGARQRIMS